MANDTKANDTNCRKSQITHKLDIEEIERRLVERIKSLGVFLSISDSSMESFMPVLKSVDCWRAIYFDLYAGTIYAKSAFELWNDLKDTYDKVDGSVVFNLHKSINCLNQNGTSLADYYNNLNSLWKQFDAMVSLHAYDNYLAIRSNILTREPLPLVKAAFAIVNGEESHRNITSSGATKPTASLHIVDRCFEILSYPAGYVKRNFIPNSRHVTNNNTTVDPHFNKASSNTTSNSLVSLSNEQLTRIMNFLNDNKVSSTNANMSSKNFMNIKGTFLNGSVKFNLNFKRFFNGNTYFVVGNISLGWIVDSGANQHMTVSTNFFVNVVDISNLGLTASHPNGTQALITKIGDLKFNNNITLYDVLVVPEYIVSLLSVHKLSRDNKLFVDFNESNCYIQDLKANKTLGIGRQFNGLYLFDVDNACKIVSNSFISTCFVSKTLWHQRLGHPADPVLDALKDSLNLNNHSTSDHLCDTCNKAKHTREPFPLSDHKSSKIGELVHLDV
ncbi:ribonuclease H-like domain-containing protein [Tanacetum coccineum]